MSPLFGLDLQTNRDIPFHGWTHIATVYDGSKAKIYINGILDSEKEVTGNMGSSHGDFYFGIFNDGRFPFSGKIDNIRIYDRALAQWEVRKLFSVGKTGKISGFVTDSSYIPIPSAKVKLWQKGSLINETLTDVNGYYVFEELFDGQYTVVGLKGGFKRNRAIGKVIQENKWSQEEFINLVLK